MEKNSIITLLLSFFPKGHKRAPSDVSVASSEDEKVPLSPSILESVPEKAEPVLPGPTPTTLPVANHVLDTSFVEQPAAPAAGKHTPLEDRKVEAGVEDASPPVEVETRVPVEDMQNLEVSVEDEKEVDTAEVPTSPTRTTEAAQSPQEEKMDVAEEEDPYKHLKMSLTLPGQDKAVLKKENEGEKAIVDKAKDDKERDSDSGSGSVADNSSVDLNLSISSFLSKTKEPGSVSIQVTHSVHKYQTVFNILQSYTSNHKLFLFILSRTLGARRRH